METSCEFHFGFWDVTASGDATLTASQNQPFAKVQDIRNEDGLTFPNVATLEPDFGWPLDGKKDLMPDNASVTTWGWWSTEMSGADKTFLHPPLLTVTFTKNHSSAGITFDFVGGLPGNVNIKWYNLSGGLLAEENYTPDRLSYFCEKQVENYGKLVITISSMQGAYQYLRVTRILFGALDLIDEARVQFAKMTEEISPIALTLPISLLELSFFTLNNRFALLDPQGAYKMFQWRQEIEAYKKIDGAKHFMGVYYLQEAAGTVDAITQLSCVDIVGILDTLEYKGGIYVNTPVSSILSDILSPEGISFELHASFTGATVSGHLPICSKREAIQQVAFAIGAVADPTRTENMRFYPAPTAVTALIEPSRKIIGHQVKLEELVTQVDVTAHNYILGTESRTLSKSKLGVGQQTITFPTPVSVSAVTGASIVTKHPNYCIVNVTSAGEVTVSGYEFNDATTIHSVKTNVLPAGAKSSVKTVDAATLVDNSKAPAVAQRVYSYYQNRYTDEGPLLPGTEKPAELTTIRSLGDRNLTGHVHRIVTDLYNGCLETVAVRGK